MPPTVVAIRLRLVEHQVQSISRKASSRPLTGLKVFAVVVSLAASER